MSPIPAALTPMPAGGRWRWLAVVALVVGASVPAMAPAGAAALPRVVYDIRTDDKVIAITIDDGYSAETCLAMARTLRRTGATATFFPVGAAVRAHPAAWRSIAADFPVANHTLHHPLLVGLSQAAIEREIRRAAKVVAAAARVGVRPYLRPPGGAWNEDVRRAAAAAGIDALIIWDTTAADTALHSSRAAMLRRALQGGPGSILLMHCNRGLSATLLPAIIRGYRARGYHFVTVEALITRAWERTSVGRAVGSVALMPGDADRPAAMDLRVPAAPSSTLRGTSDSSGVPWQKVTSSSSGARRTRSVTASS